MSKLRIEVLTPRTPYQTYLEERLQAARGLGWAMPPHTAAPAKAETAEIAEPEFVISAIGEPA